MDYFVVKDDGVLWEVKPAQEHYDDVEMSGFMADFIVKYGADANGDLFITRYSAFPTLRVMPNNTHGTLRRTYNNDNFPKLLADGKVQTEKATSFFFNGILTATAKTDCFTVSREFFPTVEKLATGERVTVKNITGNPVHFTLSTPECLKECEYKGCKGYYIMEVLHDSADVILNPDESFTFGIFSTARFPNKPRPILDIEEEYSGRKKQIRRIINGMRLETCNKELNTMFRLSVIRAGESIFHTLSGDFHSPGGKNYYAAIWANDQLEYAAPWFAMNGDSIAVKASENAFMAYETFMTEEYHPIPCSIISEGLDIWDEAGDRGDSSMFLYGACFLALFRQDKELTEKLWPLIKWCAEYTKRKTSPEGVICSRTDELETRIPTDLYANLSTSCICYGGLKLAAILAEQLGEADLAAEYISRAEKLENAIEAYYGETIHGMETYAYSKGYHTLRSWICLPLCMGINTRRDGTLKAMFSDYLWTGHGMLSCELGEENKREATWDRSVLFGFKAAMIAERPDTVWDYFIDYVHDRLCGERVPYAVEAYPENEMRHLSAESALFARIIPEGLLKLAPEGNRSFSIVPQLPKALPELSLYGIALADRKIDVIIGTDKICRVMCGETVIATGACNEKIVFTV